MRHAVPLALLLLSTGAALAQETRTFSVPKAHFTPLESAAHQMARGGWMTEVVRLVAVMKSLGYGEPGATKLLESCRKDVPKKQARSPLPAVAKSLRASARQLAKAVASDSPEAKAAAVAILTIDDSIENLHRILGREQTPEGWVDPTGRRIAGRRAEIVAALVKARKLSPEVTIAEGEDPVVKEIHGTSCAKVTASGLTLFGRWPAGKLKRVLLEALRAAAVSSYLMGGELAVPKVDNDVLLLDSEKDYQKAIDLAVDWKWLDAKEADQTRKLGGFYPRRPEVPSYKISYTKVEAHAESGVLFSISNWLKCYELCPPLRVGHLNWVCLGYLGTPMPGIVWYEDSESRRARRTASGTPGSEEAERIRQLRLSEAGISGSRSWIQYLASRGEDPPFANSIVDQDGKIEGEDRIKCTFVVEFLQEHDELVTLGPKTKFGQRVEFEEAWGSCADFEARWKKWLLGDERTIADAIDPPKPRVLSRSETEVLAHLNESRRSCFKGSICGDAFPDGIGDYPADLVDPYLEVTLDDSLSSGARKHALYLAKHQDQMAAWPDAHEEWPDREGFSPEGGWAGGHSVIAPGVSSAAEALNGWLGTYYHRLPLTHPGLMRIGWALDSGIAVLDSGSLSRPMAGPWHVVWPYDGMQSVPTRFAPELPNPVPGADQTAFGYPVTLQIGDHAEPSAPPTIAIELREGSASGPLVPCHVSTPTEPSYADLATPNAWCLIPKAHLKSTTTYFASAKWSNARKIAWSFKTGK